MTKTIQTYWSLLEQYCKITDKNECYPIIRHEVLEQYKKSVKKTYDQYKDKYLKDEVEFLDRHKMAAILVVEGIKCNVMVPSQGENVDSSKLFVGCEKILLLAAVDYLLAHMNRCFIANDLKKIDTFIYPNAFTCKTKFVDVLSRTLYYSHTDFSLNIMELAEKFFLLEYITILCTCGGESEHYFKVLRENGDMCE